ncbi:MAG: hypothetical protein AAB227_11500 [Pseudomonadota bacterium]
MKQGLLSAFLLALAACSSETPAPPAAASASGSSTARPADSPELMDKLVGAWVLSGDIAGQSVVHDIDADWALQGNYVRINEVAREKGENGLPAYEAVIYIGWLAPADRFVCLWLDNTEVASGRVTCTAAPAPDALAFEFRDEQGALMIATTFTYRRSTDTWSWRIDNVEAGVHTRFADLELRRR